MKEADIPSNEPSRLANLKRLNVLDTPLEDRFERITRMVCTLLRVPISAISLVDSDRQWFKSIQGLPVSETSRGVAFCAHTILGDEPLVVRDARKDERFVDNPLVAGHPGIVFYAGVPVSASDGLRVGSLCVIDYLPRELTGDELQVLRDFAAIAESELRSSAQSAMQADLIEQVKEEQRRGMIDSLTRVWNRSGIMEMMERELGDAFRRREQVGVVMCDIDHFKKINDTYGHPVGDTVLIEVVKRLLSAVRGHDAIGRVGGEEFLVILPACSTPELGMVAERMRTHVSERPIVTSAGPINVTMSFGTAVYGPGVERDADKLIKTADDALYLAKTSGRNRVVTSVQ